MLQNKTKVSKISIHVWQQWSILFKTSSQESFEYSAKPVWRKSFSNTFLSNKTSDNSSVLTVDCTKSWRLDVQTLSYSADMATHYFLLYSSKAESGSDIPIPEIWSFEIFQDGGRPPLAFGPSGSRFIRSAIPENPRIKHEVDRIIHCRDMAI